MLSAILQFILLDFMLAYLLEQDTYHLTSDFFHSIVAYVLNYNGKWTKNGRGKDNEICLLHI